MQSALISWASELSLVLSDELLRAREARSFVRSAAALLAESPLGVERVFISLRTLHPAFRARTYRWQSDEPEVRVVEWPHGLENRPGYYDSPDFHVHRTGSEFRCRDLSRVSHKRCDLYADLSAQGYVDYLMVPLRFSDGTINTLAVATRTRCGFNDPDLGQFRTLVGILTVILERYTAVEAVNSTLEIYLGRTASREVLKGNIQAGHGELIEAVVLFADITDFTKHAARLGPSETVRLLNEYFDCLIEPIEEHGGYVLKFIGDAVLAFFPLPASGPPPAPREAIEAVKRRLTELNRGRARHGDPPIAHAAGVHVGTVLFGNIGATRRLDFTIIGEAVNVAARVVETAKRLGLDYVFTGSFVERFPGGDLSAVGVHRLRGVPKPISLFTFQPSKPAKYPLAEVAERAG